MRAIRFPLRLLFAFRPVRYPALERGQSSVGAIWGALLPHASPLGGQALAEPLPQPFPQGGEGRANSKLQPSPLCGRGWRGEAVLPIAPGEGGRQYVTELTKASAKSNEPKRLKTLVINNIAHEAEKRTQASDKPWYQSLTAILAPILQKFVWIASALLRIAGCDPCAGRHPSLGGLPPKPQCPLE